MARTTNVGGVTTNAQERQLISTDTIRLSRADFAELAQAQLDGRATPEQLTTLATHDIEWEEALAWLYEEIQRLIGQLRTSVNGPERALVLVDFATALEEVDAQHIELTGQSLAPPEPESADDDDDDDDDDEDDEDDTPDPFLGVQQLHLSWERGYVVAWAGGNEAQTGTIEDVLDRLEAAGAGRGNWDEHEPVALPHGVMAPAVAAPIPRAAPVM